VAPPMEHGLVLIAEGALNVYSVTSIIFIFFITIIFSLVSTMYANIRNPLGNPQKSALISFMPRFIKI